MDNKLSELSKPVAYTDADELRFHHATSDMWPVPLGFGKDVPLYSQEYVSALLDALKTSQAIVNEYQQLMYHMDAGGDFYEFQRDKVMKEQSNG
ncbi:hypothetical protein [Serratia sp. MF2]|uniref:hypothetical protein n=1 Tax=Serratia sp. MF2 TaxID=3059173 RepID=UPI0027E71144|nr:hypothetical protein [Serratia sp. MF2]MDQ7101464.1 hypothetical protein [Serratia sp. MF2]